jgi:hypothetical protein
MKEFGTVPYIKREDRRKFKHGLGELTFAETPGELNYLFTKIATEYLSMNGENYQHFNDVLGALEGAKLELYRRRIAPYEDTKIVENGDVQ